MEDKVIDQKKYLINECPFKEGEIAVFESYFRFEKYISRVRLIHLENWGSGWLPDIYKATNQQKELWYNSEKHEVILEEEIWNR